MVELYIIIGASIAVSAIFILLIRRVRGQDRELSNFMQEVTQELQGIDMTNPNALKEFMNRKIDEIDGNFQDDYSEVLDHDETTE